MSSGLEERLKRLIRDVPDFPKPGILFKDITPLLADARALAETGAAMAYPYRDRGVEQVVGIESRGFILGALVARELNVGFVPVRKPGKLPARVQSVEYALEYGTDRLEVHADVGDRAARVLIVDDVLATGGTARATCDLLSSIGAEIVGLSFLIELEFLNGRGRLGDRDVTAIVRYGRDT
jgi:adenine phosphoribosyltransferase